MNVLHALAERDLLDLLDSVCRAHHVTRAEVCGRARSRRVSLARQEMWWRLHTHEATSFSLCEIARLFARNHTTVLHGVRMRARANLAVLSAL